MKVDYVIHVEYVNGGGESIITMSDVYEASIIAAKWQEFRNVKRAWVVRNEVDRK